MLRATFMIASIAVLRHSSGTANAKKSRLKEECCCLRSQRSATTPLACLISRTPKPRNSVTRFGIV
jgi:hypothetical protein